MGIRRDLTGIRFGKLKVKRFLGVFPGNGGKACSWWECECNCPDHTRVSVVATDLLTGRKRDCGCVAYNAAKTRAVKDLTGYTSGKFKVIEHTKKPIGKTHRGAYWKCQCQGCGYVIIARSDQIQSGYVELCPVCDRERYNKSHTTKRSVKNRIYQIWYAMNHRCSFETDSQYKRYGGRGISVCDDWNINNSEGFENFKSWAYNNGYYEQSEGTKHKDLLSIERIDIDKDYCPDNCTWIPMKMQVRNTMRSKRIIDADGESKLYKDFISEHEINLYYYLNQGWSLNAIVFKTANPNRNIIKTKDGYKENFNGHLFDVLIPNYGNPIISS